MKIIWGQFVALLLSDTQQQLKIITNCSLLIQLFYYQGY